MLKVFVDGETIRLNKKNGTDIAPILVCGPSIDDIQRVYSVRGDGWVLEAYHPKYPNERGASVALIVHNAHDLQMDTDRRDYQYDDSNHPQMFLYRGLRMQAGKFLNSLVIPCPKCQYNIYVKVSGMLATHTIEPLVSQLTIHPVVECSNCGWTVDIKNGEAIDCP